MKSLEVCWRVCIRELFNSKTAFVWRWNVYGSRGDFFGSNSFCWFLEKQGRISFPYNTVPLFAHLSRSSFPEDITFSTPAPWKFSEGDKDGPRSEDQLLFDHLRSEEERLREGQDSAPLRISTAAVRKSQLEIFEHTKIFVQLPSCDTITDPLKKIELFKALASPAFIGQYILYLYSYWFDLLCLMIMVVSYIFDKSRLI